MFATPNQISHADNLARKAGFEGGYQIAAYEAYNDLVGESKGLGQSVELTHTEIQTLINYFNAYPEAKKEIEEAPEKAEIAIKLAEKVFGAGEYLISQIQFHTDQSNKWLFWEDDSPKWDELISLLENNEIDEAMDLV